MRPKRLHPFRETPSIVILPYLKALRPVVLAVAIVAAGSSGDPVLDVAADACARHQEAGGGYPLSYASCPAVVATYERLSASHARYLQQRELDAMFYADAEPPDARDLFKIGRAVDIYGRR